jgi:Xaa-Pro aminopeptidase
MEGVSVRGLPRAERDRRYAALRAATAEAGLDGLLAYAAGWRREQVRYLTGAPIRGSFAFAYLPLAGEPVAFGGEPWDRAAIEAAGWVEDVRPLDALADVLRAGARGTLGVAHLELLPEAFRDVVAGARARGRLASATHLAATVQMVKSGWELERVRAAAALCDAGWEAFVAAAEEGVRDHGVVARVEQELKRRGAEDNFTLPDWSIGDLGPSVRHSTPCSPNRYVSARATHVPSSRRSTRRPGA